MVIQNQIKKSKCMFVVYIYIYIHVHGDDDDDDDDDYDDFRSFYFLKSKKTNQDFKSPVTAS